VRARLGPAAAKAWRDGSNVPSRRISSTGSLQESADASSDLYDIQDGVVHTAEPSRRLPKMFNDAVRPLGPAQGFAGTARIRGTHRASLDVDCVRDLFK